MIKKKKEIARTVSKNTLNIRLNFVSNNEKSDSTQLVSEAIRSIKF